MFTSLWKQINSNICSSSQCLSVCSYLVTIIFFKEKSSNLVCIYMKTNSNVRSSLQKSIICVFSYLVAIISFKEKKSFNSVYHHLIFSIIYFSLVDVECGWWHQLIMGPKQVLCETISTDDSNKGAKSVVKSLCLENVDQHDNRKGN